MHVAAAFAPSIHRRSSVLAPSNSHRSASKTSLQAKLIPDIIETPRTLVSRGMESFRNYDVPTSLSYFDKADALVPDGSLRPYLWQRGISYYYLDDFQRGSEQFRLDVAVNPLDVEEIVWDIACLARMDGKDGSPLPAFPPEKRMSLPQGKKDRRKIMGTVYSLYRGDGATEFDLRKAGHDGNISDEFYSLFYLGLYCEIRNETSKAEMYMKTAASSPYATGVGSGDYMSACAKVHCKLRGWA